MSDYQKAFTKVLGRSAKVRRAAKVAEISGIRRGLLSEGLDVAKQDEIYREMLRA